MTTVRIDVEANEVFAYLKDVPNAVGRAAYRAINQMSPYVRKESIDRIIGYRRLSRREIGKGIIFAKRARATDLTAVWRAQGEPLDLKDFIISPKGYTMPSGGAFRKNMTNPKTAVIKRSLRYQSPPIVVEVRKGRRITLHNSFIGPNGHVFRRLGPNRLKIAKRMVPSIPATFVKAEIQAAVERDTRQRLPQRIESEMVRELRRAQTGKLPPLG
jgi:hypothetical protein